MKLEHVRQLVLLSQNLEQAIDIICAEDKELKKHLIELLSIKNKKTNSLELTEG